MGGDWGGTAIPIELENMYAAYSGSDTVPSATGGANPFDEAPVYPTYNMREQIERFWQDAGYDSPYALVQLHDPNPDIEEALDRFTVHDDALGAANAPADWSADADAVATRVDATVSWINDIDSIVADYEEQSTPELMRAQARFLAGMSDINAAHGTQAWQGMAILEGESGRNSRDFRAKVTLAGYAQRAQAVLAGTSEVQGMRKFLTEQGRLAVLQRAGLSQMNIAANSDLVANQLKVDVQADMWNINLLDNVKAVNVIAGAPALQRPLDQWQAGLSLGLTAAGSFFNMIPGLAALA